MAEEHRCQAPEGHRLCANNCGFFGSAATMNLCSKCYRDFCLQEQQQASLKASLSAASSSSSPSPSPVIDSQPPADVQVLPDARLPDTEASAAVEQPNRCSACRRRLGLTGFKCRCGTTFCGVHRYPEKHGCTFDFKKVGREEIARANPLVLGEKLDKI